MSTQLWILIRKHLLVKSQQKFATCCELFAPLFLFAIIFCVAYFLLNRVYVPATLNLSQTQNPSNWGDQGLEQAISCGRQWGKTGTFTSFGTEQAIGFASSDPALKGIAKRFLEFTRRSILRGVTNLNGGYNGVDSNAYSSCGAFNGGSSQPNCAGLLACDSVSTRVGYQCVSAGKSGTCQAGQVFYQGACSGRPCVSNSSGECLVNGACAQCPQCPSNSNWDNQANACTQPNQWNCIVNGKVNQWYTRRQYDCIYTSCPFGQLFNQTSDQCSPLCPVGSCMNQQGCGPCCFYPNCVNSNNTACEPCSNVNNNNNNNCNMDWSPYGFQNPLPNNYAQCQIPTNGGGQKCPPSRADYYSLPIDFVRHLYSNNTVDSGSSFRFFDSEADMLAYTQTSVYGMDEQHRGLWAGVSLQKGVQGQKWSYRLYVNWTDTPSMDQTVNVLLADTINNQGQNDQYINSRYASLQIILDDFFLSLETGSEMSPRTNVSFSADSVGWATFPMQSYVQDYFKAFMEIQFQIMHVLAYMWPFSRFVKFLVEEKEDGTRGLLDLLGVSSLTLWLSWGIVYGVIFGIITVIAVAGFQVQVFSETSVALLAVLYTLYGVSLISFAFFMSTLFATAKTAGTVSAFALLLCFVPYFAVVGGTMSAISKILLSLFSPTAFALALDRLLDYQVGSQGATLNAIFDVVGNYSLIYSLVMLAFDAVLYLVLAWYVAKVFPTEDQVPYPWYFPLKMCFCCCCKSQPALSKRNVESVSSDYFEHVPADLAGQPGLHIRGLTKQFPGAPHPAVSDFNLSCFDGQIFVLLGHNGAGKSTALNMLTGTVAPTSGTAEVFGHSITDPEGLERIRQITGYCPQKDILYSLLTVQQHLYFFAALKGLSSDDQSALVEKYLKEIQLVDARHTLASDLSGGMKRRLCLAIGFITGSKVVYVDEVTSGIDPASRRAIWNILMRKRDDPKEGKRVIILTTHFMDEADYLGDRIGIMHGGKLVCCGSSMFLKSKFGVGYDLTINVASAGIESVCNNVGSLLRTHVPSAELRGTISAAEAIFRLPLTAAPQFPAMLQDLENNKRRLGMESFGLSVTTLEDVFLRVADINAHQSKPANESAHKGFDDAMLNFSDFAPSWRRQMYSMFIKRLHLSRRDPKMWMLSLVLPCLIIALGLGLLKLPINIAQNVNLLSISAQYGDNTAVPIFAGSLQSPMSSGHKIASLNGPHAFPLYSTDLKFNATQWDGTMVRNFSSALLSTAGQNASRYGALLFADPKNYVIYINKSAVHAVPTFLNYAHQALLRYYTNNPTIELNTELTVFPPTLSERAQIQTVLGIVTTVIILLSFAFIPGSAPALLIKEVEIKFKHMQVISGMSSSAYWFANYLFDVLQYCISGAAVGALIWYFGGANFSGDGLYVLISVIAMYGVSVYPFVYFISLGFSSHSTGQNAIILLLIVLSIILLLVSTVLQVIPSVSGAYDQWVQYLMRIFPSFTLANTINNLTMRDTIKLSVWDWNFCVLNFLSMGAQAVGYMLLILLAEQLNDVTLCYSCRRRNAAIVDAEADQAANADIDVSNERAAIMQDMAQEKIQSRLISDKLISLRGLRRVYPNKIAVRNLWFGVSKGECFGFLGSNGAGKSTALRMLTSEELPEAGTARLANLDLLDQTAMVHRRIGYCPQYDALPELLTPTELLFMFGRLRGISEVDLPVLVDLLIARLALTDGKHKPCGKLSGGNKRKCALALALIGNPAVVFLDEPTTGVDPASRRQLWDFIAQTGRTRAVILTTHSMEECEALCSRVGILIDGALKCLGSSQHLKNRFADGYLLSLQLHDSAPSVSHRESQALQVVQIDSSRGEQHEPIEMQSMSHGNDENSVESQVRAVVPAAQLLEHVGSTLKFRIPRTEGVTLPSLFANLERLRTSLGISQYALGQETLDNIFLRLVGDAAKAKAAAK